MNTLILSLIGLSAIVLIATITLQNPSGGVIDSPIKIRNQSARTVNNIAEKSTWITGAFIVVLSIISNII